MIGRDEDPIYAVRLRNGIYINDVGALPHSLESKLKRSRFVTGSI